MRSKTIIGTFAIITAVLTISLGMGTAFGQGKGKGGDRGGSKQEKQGQRQGQRQEQAQRPQRQGQRQERGQRQEQAQRPQREQRDERQQQQRAERPQREQQNERRSQGDIRFEQRQQQAQRQQSERSGGQQKDVRKNANDLWSGDQPRYRPQVRNENDGDIGNRQQRLRSNNAWPNNYGYERSREVHFRNAERKALKIENRSYGQNLNDRTWFAYRYTDAPNYRYPRYSDRNHQRWNDVLRMVVGNMFGLNAGHYDDNYPRYASVSYGEPYYQPYNGDNYYNAYPDYENYAYYQQYGDDPNYGYSYSPDYYGSPYYQSMDNGSYQSPAVVISFGGDFGRRMSGQLLALGYDQGYNDGLYAADAGYGDRYYNDPYIYQDTMYDPYSYSIGENRRTLSNGYELGYADAQYPGRPYDRYQNGRVDLVSLLIGSALTIF